MTYVGGVIRWGIEAGAPTLFNQVHKQWSDEIVTRTLAPGWSTINFFNGVVWRQFYYSQSWADTYNSITGLQYGDIWEM